MTFPGEINAAWTQYVSEVNESRAKWNDAEFNISDKNWVTVKIGFYAGYEFGAKNND